MIKGHKDITSTPGGDWVDVRDVATAHVNAIVPGAAGGEHFIVASVHHCTASDAVLAALPKGTPGAGKDGAHPVLLDTTKARTALGMKFRQLSEIAQDTARSLLANEKSCRCSPVSDEMGCNVEGSTIPKQVIRVAQLRGDRRMERPCRCRRGRAALGMRGALRLRIHARRSVGSAVRPGVGAGRGGAGGAVRAGGGAGTRWAGGRGVGGCGGDEGCGEGEDEEARQ
ncbi:hypothetical protein JB92DRAFT_3225130 [Gautieria morchelliformis]|nr:hypothetical protein JB92DRAFT_3225130 [Gautieria morchelliformis]